MRKYLVSGRNTYTKAIYCPNGRQHTDIKMSCLWFVCSLVHRSIWSGLKFWHSCEPAFKILLHLGTWICTSYTCWLLSICTILVNIFATPPLILYTYIHTYIHTYTRYTFFLNSSLFMMALSSVFVIHIKVIRSCWYLGFYKLTIVSFKI